MYVLLKYRTGGGNIVVIEEGEEQMARDTVVVEGAVIGINSFLLK
jgi:hypothetical protein